MERCNEKITFKKELFYKKSKKFDKLLLISSRVFKKKTILLFVSFLLFAILFLLSFISTCIDEEMM